MKVPRNQRSLRALLLDAEGAAFDDIKAITAAYEIALKRLNVLDRKAAMAVLVAKATIQMAGGGERDSKPKRKSSTRSFRVILN
jgi:hypothetical protein